MKYSVSVVKRITLLIMTLALAVAMVACTGATSVKGETGATGAQGDAGPAGPPGTLDNEQPMVTAPLPMIYLAMAGTGVMKTSAADDLSGHFSDAENASLNYQFESSDKDVATAELNSDGNMIVKAQGVGSATITVTVYDGVTDAVSETFEVMVVANNHKPFVSLGSTFHTAAAADADSSLEALRKKLFVTNPRGKTTISATIHAGNDTFSDDVTFEFHMGAAGDADNVVAVDITEKAGAVNMWEIELTPLAAGTQNVYVVVKDKFGATYETPVNHDENGNGVADTSATAVEDAPAATDNTTPHSGGQMFGFVAFVNAVPKLDKELSDKTILVKAAGTDGDSYIKVSEHFETGEKAPSKGPKVGNMAVQAPAPGSALLGTSPAAGSTDAQWVGLVTADALDNNTSCTVSTSDKSVVEVHSAASGFPAAAVDSLVLAADADDVFIKGRKAGTAIVTVTCRDEEGSASSAATITVRAPRA